MNDNQNTDACAAFGSFVRERRKTLGKTARAVAVEIGMQPSNYCKLEYGALQPPNDPRKLVRLVEALELPSGHQNTHTFYDLAGGALSSVPQDIADIISRDEAVPMMLRTLGCRKLTQEDLDEIAFIVRGKA